MGGPGRGRRGAPRLGGVRREHVFPRGQGMASALLPALSQCSGHDREEGRPQRVAASANLPAAHRIAAGARQARARAVEGGGRAASAAADAAGPWDEGAWQFARSTSERSRPRSLEGHLAVLLSKTGWKLSGRKLDRAFLLSLS